MPIYARDQVERGQRSVTGHKSGTSDTAVRLGHGGDRETNHGGQRKQHPIIGYGISIAIAPERLDEELLDRRIRHAAIELAEIVATNQLTAVRQAIHLQQALHTRTGAIRTASSPAIISLSGFITLDTWKAVGTKATLTGAKCFVSNATLFIQSMEQQKKTAARAFRPADAGTNTILQAITDLRDLTRQGTVVIDIEAESAHSSLPQRKAHTHIQLH